MCRYETRLNEAKKNEVRKSYLVGLLVGSGILFNNIGHALVLWYGFKLTGIVDESTGLPEYTIGKIILVLMNVLSVVQAIDLMLTQIASLTEARVAAVELFEILERQPAVDGDSDEGLRPNKVLGSIEFRNVSFRYPARPEVNALDSFSVKIEPGQTIALVGSSGSGKSTCMQLLQRFYDPTHGSILIDDNELTSLNVKWLRKQLGVVNQEVYICIYTRPIQVASFQLTLCC